ncbi:MAG: RNA polymerase sigma factor [Oscillospiraceae bacterium]|nr:RNA polymerase sigma factor [Oscillospiraceae bacterium]
MKPVSSLFKKIADDYSLMILNWAIKKTGNRPDGEDLAQEVLYQILSFVKDREEIEKLDNLIWKIAHYTWCNRIRRLKKENNIISLDGENGLYVNIIEERDYINEIAENDELKEELANLRRRISDLSKQQREIIIAYYLENLSVSDIAAKYNINKSAVKWHLFDARKKLKEKFDMNNNVNEKYVYKPGKLRLGYNGDGGPDPDTKRVNESLIRQNICLLCYGDNGKSLDELAEMTGIPKPYLEFDLDWLVDREFLALENKKYITNFGIKDKQHFENVRDIYINVKENYYRKIIDYINSHEKDIRNIGFYGGDFDWNKLLWSILTLYLRYFSESEPLKTLKKYNELKSHEELELHKDGGRYFINGFDQSENQGVKLPKMGVITEAIFEPEKWNTVNGIWCRSFSETTSEFSSDEHPEEHYATYWLGIYIFVNIMSTLTKNIDQQKDWKKILENLLSNNFSIDGMTDDEKELIATAVKENIIKKDGDKYIPQFVIFTFEQFKKLYSEIFAPLVQSVKPQTLKLVDMFRELNEKCLPRKIYGYVERWTYLDIWDSGIKNFMFAADDGYLYMPETPEDGTCLTLSFIY